MKQETPGREAQESPGFSRGEEVKGWTPADLVILLPVLGRHWHIPPLLATIDATVPGARSLFLVTPGDDEVAAAIDEAGREMIEVPRQPRGDYQRKINTGYRATTEPLLFLGASDLAFHPGWYEATLAKLTPGIGVVGTNDLGNPYVIAGQHSTHSLVTRVYADQYGLIDQPGAILCEQYPHEYCDNELVATAQYRDAYAHAGDAHVEHLHPHWDKAPTDPLYDAQAARMAIGRRIYNRRARMWTQ